MNRNGKRYTKASPNATRPEAIPLKFNNYLCGSIVFYSILSFRATIMTRKSIKNKML